MSFNKYEVTDFELAVDKALAEYKDKPLEERKEKANQVIEDYYSIHEKLPDSYQLTRLGDLILQDDLSNPSSYKVQQEDYPFHSHTQQKRRRKKEFSAEDTAIDFMNFKSKTHQSTAPPKDLRAGTGELQ